MAKREPLFEADLGNNGGLLRLWNEEDVERFIAEEQSFWRAIHQGNMNPPFNVVESRTVQMAEHLRKAAGEADKERGSRLLHEYFGAPDNRIPLSTSQAALGVLRVSENFGKEAARGALGMVIPLGIWGEGIHPASRPHWRGMIEQVVYESGLTPAAIEAAKRTMIGLNGRASQVLAGIEDRAAEQVQAAAIGFEKALEHQHGRNAELERQRLEALHTFQQRAKDIAERLEATHAAYLEHMKLKAPVKYWSEKAAAHKTAARELRNWVAGFFGLMIGGYAVAFIGLHPQFSAFLLQFQGSTGALLVISAVVALLASLPLWIGRLLVKFYLSEHHLATDAKERETMTQTYLALTAEGAVDEKDRALILGALFRSTPDGVVKDNTQPDAGLAAIVTKILDSR